MNRLVPFVFAFLLIVSCSKSDSNEAETEKEPISNLPTLSTNAVSEITQISAVSGGNITDDGNAAITARGVCWSLTSNPTISDNKIASGTGTGVFSENMENLIPSTTYYVRAYATNSKGTGYANEISFITLESDAVSKVYEGDVILSNQQEVDEFGSEGYTEINGFLKFGPEIENVRKLQGLQIIQGDLDLRFLKNLTTLEGLDDLVFVGEDLTIAYCDVLDDLTALGNIQEVVNYFSIHSNVSLTELPSFTEFKKTTGLEITSNNSLISINGFNSLEELDNLVISSNSELKSIISLNNIESLISLAIIDNFSLEQLDSFNNLSIVSGAFPSAARDLLILRNQNLKLIEGFEVLDEVVNDLIIKENSSLTEIKTFRSLSRVGNEINIFDNERLLTVNTFSNLQSCSSLFLSSNASLTEINNFDELLSISERLVILENINLERIDSFNNLTTVGTFWVTNNDVLNSFEGFSTLNEIQNDLILGSSPNLSDFSLSLEKIGGKILLGGTNITDLSIFSNLIELGGDIGINSNPLLTNFCDIVSVINSGWSGNCNITDNGFNPTCQEIADGICSN